MSVANAGTRGRMVKIGYSTQRHAMGVGSGEINTESLVRIKVKSRMCGLGSIGKRRSNGRENLLRRLREDKTFHMIYYTGEEFVPTYKV